MEHCGIRCPAAAGTRIVVDDPAWRRTVRKAEAMAARAARAAGVTGTVLLASDAALRRLNARYRGRNKPTNVLTFEPAGPGVAGELVLAFGAVRREAAQAGRQPTHHLAHLIVHGGLHLQGHDNEGLAAFQKLKPSQLEKPSISLYYGVLLTATGKASQAAPYLQLARTKGQLLPEEKQLLTETDKMNQAK